MFNSAFLENRQQLNRQQCDVIIRLASADAFWWLEMTSVDFFHDGLILWFKVVMLRKIRDMTSVKFLNGRLILWFLAEKLKKIKDVKSLDLLLWRIEFMYAKIDQKYDEKMLGIIENCVKNWRKCVKNAENVSKTG